MISTLGCAGFPISLSGPTDGSNYQWTPTTGLANANSPTTEVTFSGAATYNLTYTDPNGCIAFFEQTVTEGVCAEQTAIGDFVWLDANRDGIQDPSETGIPNLQVFLYASNNLMTPIASTLTDFSGKYLFNPLPAGEYVIGFAQPGTNFTATTANNSTNDEIDSDMDETTLQTPPQLIANGDEVLTLDAGFIEYECTVSVASGIERICLGTSLQLGASVGGDVTDFQWEDAIDLAANPSPASTTLSDVNILNPLFTPTATGVYTFYFIGSNINPNLCSDTATLSIIVEGEANPVIISDSTICAGGTTTLFAAGGTTYEWFENGVPVGNGTSLVINPTNTSTYRLVATTDFGCTDDVEKTITVLDELAVVAGTDTEICAGKSAMIAAQTGFDSYNWVAIPSGEAYSGATITVSPMMTTEYALTVVDSNGCMAMDIVLVTVNDLPIPAFTVNNSCGLNPISFTNNSTNAINYTWDFGDGTATSSDNNPTHTYSTVGTYTVQLIANNANSCVDSISQQINVGTITASLSADQSICPDEAVTLVASGGTSYVWKRIDGLGGNIIDNNLGTNSTYNTGNLSATTIYRVVIDNGTCIDSLETTVTIFTAQSVATSGDNTICQGETASITANAGFTNYTWVAETDGTTFSGQTITVNPLVTTTYNLTAVDANGCEVTGRFEVTVNPTPEANFTVNGDCNLNPVTFTNTSTLASGNITSNSWDFGDGNTSTSPSPTHIYAAAGTYRVALTVTSDNNCTDVYTQTIAIGTINTAITPGTTICVGDNLDLIAAGGANYTWKQLDGINGNITNSNLGNLSIYNTGSLTTTSFYRVIISNATCVDSLETVVTIAPANTIAAGSDQTICNGETAALVGEFGHSNYQWVGSPGGEILLGRIVFVSPMINTTYTLTATDPNGCEVSDDLIVFVNSQPTAAFSSDSMCVLNGINFTNNSTVSSGFINNYAWDFGDGIGTSTDENPTYMYNAEGTYPVKLVLTSNFGCVDSITQNIFIDSISASITPNHDICANESTTLVASGGESYVWKELDGAGGNIIDDNVSTLATFITDPLTTTTVYRVIIETNNCIDSLETVVTVWLPNTIEAGNDQTICEGESTTLVAENNFMNYNWVSLPDGAIFAGQTIIVNPTVTSQFALTANDDNGCIVRDTLQVTVNPNPTANFTVMGSCGLNPINFTSTSTGGTIYSWDFGDGVGTSTNENPSYTYTSTGIYEVKLIVTSVGNCQDSITQQITVGNLPITISPNQSICPNTPATLVASGGTTYTWKILDAPNGNITNANAGNLPTYTTENLTQTTTFRVVVSDNNCTDSLETTVTINTPIVINAGNDQSICAGEVTNISAQVGFTNYQWQDTNTGLIYYGKDVIAVSPAISSFFALQAEDLNGCLTFDTLEITVNPLPTVAFTHAGECVLNEVVFSNNSTGGTTYSWDFGDGAGTSLQASPSYIYMTQGTYAVKLVATTDEGCQDSLIQNITIDSIAPSLTTNQTICPNTGTTLVATGGSTYVWKLLDGPNGTILDANLSNLSVYQTGALSADATYRVIFDNNNCLDSLETTVTISTIATLNAGNDVNICGGETANLSAPIGFSSYQWKNLTTGALFIGQTVNVTPDATTDYEITANDGNGCTVIDTIAVIVNPQPIPSFTVMGSCGLNPINFTSTSTVPSGTITDWRWDFGDGNTSDGIPNPSNTYIAAGTYEVLLVVETDFGCTDSITQEIVVGSLPITISADQSICPNETADLVASGGTTYLWKILGAPNGNTTNANAGNQATYTTTALTETTTFRVIVGDNNCTDSLETTVTVNTPQTINAGTDQNICEGETATLLAQSGFTNYAWVNLNNGLTFTGQSIEVTPTATNDYALAANDVNGCLTHDTVQVIVNPSPIADFITAGECTLNPVIFTNNSSITNGTIDTYTWNFGDGTGTSTDENPIYPFANEGTYLVTLVIESNTGCRDSSIQEIIIGNLPIMVSADQGICPNETTDLVASGGDTYLWKILDDAGNIVNANAGNLPIYTTNPLTDTTTFRVIVSNNNCIDSLETTVNVFVPATLNAGNDQTICAGETANLSAQIGFTNYQWNNLTTGDLFAGKDIVVSPAITTQFALQANDGNGCLVHDTLQINIDPQPIVDFTTAGNCVLNAIEFINNSSVSTGNITTFNWTFGDGVGTSMLENPSYPYTIAGTYQVKLIVETDQGCTDSLTQFIVVNGSNPVVSASQSICPNVQANLFASGAINYTWKELDAPNGNIVNNNLSSLSTYTTIPLTTETTYRVIFDNGNCIDSLETTVSIFTPATLNAGNDQTICTGETINLTAQTGFTNYQWKNLMTGNLSVGETIAVTLSDTTEFALQANDANGCLVFDTLQINVNPLPIANFTTTGDCVLNAVSFTNNSSISAGNITTYNWDFGDGTGTSMDENPSYSYTTAGTYAVKLVIESDLGCMDSLTQSITVNAINPVLTTNQTICPNESANLVASGADNYIWRELDRPNGNILNNNLSTASTYTTPTLTTETTYRVIFDNGSCIDSLETTVSIFTPATLNAGNDETICAGELQTLTAQNGFTSYNWTNLQNGATFMGQSIMVSPSVTSQFALQANDVNGCLVLDTLLVMMNPNPTTAFTVTGSCGLNAIDFTNTSTISSGSITTYTWDFGDGVGMSTDENPSYTYTVAGMYEVKLVVTSDQNCQDSLSKTINVGNLPITVSADQSICPNEQATLIASGGTTYLWKILDGPNGNIIDANANDLSTYITDPLTQTTTFRVVVSDDNCIDSLETTVTILTPSSIDAGMDITICVGEIVNLNGQTGFINYTWTTIPGGAAFFGPNIIVNPTQNTEYVLTANDVNGCMVTDTVAVFLNETPIANINNENPILCPVGPNDLVLIALPQMGVAPYVYNWTGPNGFVSTDSIVTRLNPLEEMSGIYTLQITDANGCVSELTETEVIIRSTLDEPILSYSGPACEGTTMTLTTQEYTGEQVQFIWTRNGDTLNSISHQLVINPVSLADTGNYAVTVIVNECAAYSDTLLVEIYAQPATMIATVAPQSCVTGNEELELIALPSGVAPYTYAWSGPNGFMSTDSIATILNITSAASGNYTLQITDANGCTSEIASTEVDITDGIDQPILTTTGAVCESGQITLSVQNYVGTNVLYSWEKEGNPITNINNELIINPVTIADIGEYSVIVTVDGCSANSDTIQVEVFEQPTTAIQAVAPITCVEGTEELELVALPANGVVPYTYLWSGNGFTSTDSIATLTNITAANSGTYTLQITDTNGCTSDIASTEVDITDGIDQPILTTTGTVCEGGQIILLVQNYVGTDVLYSWEKDGNPITNINNELIINSVTTADIGEYSVIITVDGCSANSDTIQVDVFEQPTTTIQAVAPITCVEGTEELNIVSLPANGVAPYTYAWSGPNGFTSTDSIATILNITSAASGNYTLQITDANGCTSEIASTEVDITDGIDQPILTTTGAVCEGEQITLSVQNYVGTNVLYSWKKDGNPITNINNELIINPITTADIGEYSVIITVDGCSANSDTIQVDVFEQPTTTIQAVAPITCVEGTEELNIVSLPANGVAPYTYAWSGPNGFTSTDSIATILNITSAASGNYTLQITDANGCTSEIASTEVDITDGIEQPILTTTGAICEGAQITLSVQNYVGTDVLYSWKKEGNPITNINTGLIINPVTIADIGEYSVIVTVDGCSANSDTIQVEVFEQPTTAIQAVAPITCVEGTEELELVALPANGVVPYTYLWSGNGFTSTDSIATLTNITAANSGTYTLQITDTNGCTSDIASTEVDITDGIDQPILTTTGAVCEGEQIILLVQNYVGTDVLYSWEKDGNPITNINNELIINPVTTADIGGYSVIVTVDGCSSNSDTIQVEVFEQPTITIQAVAPITCVEGTEELELVALPANGVVPYTYLWSGNGFTSTDSIATLTNITAANSGTYTLQITDANGCTSDIASTEVDITDGIDQPILTTTGAVCEGEQITLSVQNYVGTNVLYSWKKDGNPITNINNELIINPVTTADIGEYSVIVTVDGCSANSDTIQVEVFEQPTTTIQTVAPITCVEGTEELNIISLPADGAAPYTYAWSGPNGFTSTDSIATLTNITASNSGTYTLQITDANGCTSDIASTEVDITDGIDQPILTTTGAVCEGEQITLSVQNYVGTNVLYSWKKDGNPITNINNELIINPVTTADIGEYSVIVTVDGCSANSDTIQVEVFEQPTTTIQTVAPITCVEGTEELNIISLPADGAAPYTYAWSGPNGFTSTDSIATLTNITASNSGTYTLQITDANGCTSEIASTEVDITDGIDQPILTTTGTVCEDGQITLSVQNYVGTNVLYLWEKDGTPITNINNELIINPVTTADIGEYSVIVTVDGCSANSDTIQVEVFQPTTTIQAVAPITCVEGTEELELVALPANGVVPYTYLWSGNGFTSTDSIAILTNITAANSGTYTLQITDTNGCTSDIASIDQPILTTTGPHPFGTKLRWN